ncbi:Kin of IRRE-like protein 3 [Operophtera brumata]|uniref:Kin of IRRE-like protein 3 n=1 Tax=Operophtera brumata TaxID=104452 RepID=A0A0L7L3B9_OPEBR|nr:Kin of IRRE-like protein 3 [Operophtera brumata]
MLTGQRIRLQCHSGLRPGSSGVNAELPDIIKVSAVTGGDATLPCDTHSPQPSDVLLLVACYDGRVSGPASHWADDTLTGRAHWHNAEPSTLQIRDVVPTDRALYRCRVDFKISPTLNQKILLDVIELPEKPKIFNELDKEVLEFAGPYIEDISMKLTCVVSGGNPMPRLRWWRDDKVISTLLPVTDGSSLSMLELRIPKLTREYYEAVYYCTADNTALVQPLRVNVQIQLYLRPLLVEILTREQPLSVNQKADIACRTTSDNQNETLSILRWTPQMENNGQVLACRASHAVLKHSTVQSNFTLDLHYVPIVVLKLGSKLNPEDIEEGDDVYFECAVRANPPAYKVVWEHNGQPMTHNQRAGIIAGSAHLALQGVSREQAGRYSCTASNVEGDGKSTPVTLQVVYKPVCKMTAMAFVGATINEKVEISCEVDAYPRPESFQWLLNNSLGSVELESVSRNCKASNMGGQQAEPCRYTLVAAVRPDRPHNCSTYNMTDDSVELRCMAGYDGGLQAEYIVEAWQSDDLLLNVSSSAPVWKLRGLGSGKALKLVFYSHNARGRSENSTVRVHTRSRLALHTEPNSTIDGADITWILGVLLGLAGAISVVMVITLLARRRYHQSAEYAAPIGTKAYSSTLNGNRSPIQPDDKNPDVVPLAKGL